MITTKDIRGFMAEFIGTFFIVFITCWSFTALRSEKIDYLGLGIANAFVVAGCVWAGVTYSGAHYNPAITIVKLFIRNMNLSKALFYIVSQLVASFLATLLVMLLISSDPKDKFDTNYSFPQKLKNVTDFQAFIMEFVLSMLYVFVYFATVIDKRAPSNIFGFALGAVFLLGIISAGPYTGACINPARVFGPYLLTGQIENSVVYWMANLTGGVFAGFYYDFFLLKNDDIENEDENNNEKANMMSKDNIQEAMNLRY